MANSTNRWVSICIKKRHMWCAAAVRVLGPTLFSLYVNGFPPVLQSSNGSMYAEYTPISFRESTFVFLQHTVSNGLLAVSKWFRDNQLLIYADMTKHIFHSRMRYFNCGSINISLNNRQTTCSQH